MADSESPSPNPQATGASWTSFIKVCAVSDLPRVHHRHPSPR